MVRVWKQPRRRSCAAAAAVAGSSSSTTAIPGTDNEYEPLLSLAALPVSLSGSDVLLPLTRVVPQHGLGGARLGAARPGRRQEARRPPPEGRRDGVHPSEGRVPALAARHRRPERPGASLLPEKLAHALPRV